MVATIALVLCFIALAPPAGSKLMPESPSAAVPTPPRAPIAASSGSAVFAMNRAPPMEPATHLPRTPSTVNPPKPQAPPVPFSFLGKITEDGETKVVLYRGGRTLTVRHAGPLDDQYQVDEIHDDRLVLRYLPLGVQQVLGLSSQQYAFIPNASPEDTPQD
jgi:hypothetical protein